MLKNAYAKDFCCLLFWFCHEYLNLDFFGKLLIDFIDFFVCFAVLDASSLQTVL